MKWTFPNDNSNTSRFVTPKNFHLKIHGRDVEFVELQPTCMFKFEALNYSPFQQYKNATTLTADVAREYINWSCESWSLFESQMESDLERTGDADQESLVLALPEEKKRDEDQDHVECSWEGLVEACWKKVNTCGNLWRRVLTYEVNFPKWQQ